ncbi:hypothetical protein Tco_0516433 [Tanacetum coccineum]
MKPPLRCEPNHHRKETAKTHGHQKSQLLIDYLIAYIEEKQKSMDIESICAAAGTVDYPPVAPAGHGAMWRAGLRMPRRDPRF